LAFVLQSLDSSTPPVFHPTHLAQTAPQLDGLPFQLWGYGSPAAARDIGLEIPVRACENKEHRLGIPELLIDKPIATLCGCEIAVDLFRSVVKLRSGFLRRFTIPSIGAIFANCSIIFGLFSSQKFDAFVVNGQVIPFDPGSVFDGAPQAVKSILLAHLLSMGHQSWRKTQRLL
jgi:hypothetical protein